MKKPSHADLAAELGKIKKKVARLEAEIEELTMLNALNEFLLPYGRKAYFLFGPFDHDMALSKLERDSNWPWREVNRRCNFCGCYLFPAKELDSIPPMNTQNIDFEQASRERLLEDELGNDFDAEIRERILKEPEMFLTFFYARGRKVPFGDYSVLYFHATCFERILKGEFDRKVDRGRFLGND